MIINPVPYKSFEEKFFKDPVIIQLRKADFSNHSVVAGNLALRFHFCFFNDLTIECDEELEFADVSIGFQHCFIRNFLVENVKSENVSLHFHACMLAARISSPALAVVNFNNCLLEDYAAFSNLQKVELSYTTENIDLYWWNQMFEKRSIKDFKVYLNKIQRYQLDNIEKLHIRSSRRDSDRTGPYIMQGNYRFEYVWGYRLRTEEEDQLKISININFAGDVSDKSTLIEQVTLHSLALSGNPGGKVTIENVNVGNMYLSEFSPKDEASFYNIDPRSPHDEETKISIHRCNLDKIWFDNVYFGEFDRLSFYRSKVSNATFTSCSFPEDYATYEKFLPIKNIHYPDQRSVNHHKDQYEIFLQLKKALEATGNIYEGLKLQAISQTALNRISSISRADKFILYTNRISNNHGLSIKKPLYWFLRVTVVFYLFYLWSAGLLFRRTEFDPDLIGYYFSFVDITHKNDFLKEKSADMNAISLMLDYINKVLAGYLIFQFVAAFRKYGKRA